MKRATVVIGANFGDCGKGLLTDYYAASFGSDGLVVRFNGSAQAGHTVVTPEGKRHVFSHFSAGTFVKTPTYLSKFFVVNPLLYFKELALLDGIRPRVYVDAGCPLTTPYDMMINQIIENARGDGRHGSCGVGFGETIERNLQSTYHLTVADISLPNFIDRLIAIRKDYVPQRLRRLGLDTYNDQYIKSDGIFDAYVAEAFAFVNQVSVVKDASILRYKQNIIFEGAQGLLLDEEHPWFPYVTRSKTGLRNVIALAQEGKIDSLDVTYVTRAYMTRHGVGPFPSECECLPYPGIVDQTNVKNEFQGSLRFGWLDLDLLRTSIATDLREPLGSGIAVTHRLAVTCLDQLPPTATYIVDGHRQSGDIESLVELALNAAGARQGLISQGPTRQDVSPSLGWRDRRA